MSDQGEPNRLTGNLAACIIAGIAVLRLLTNCVELRVFDVDPLLDPEPMAAMWSSWSFALDVTLFLASALAFRATTREGRRICCTTVTLALIPIPVLLLHGWSDTTQMWRGSTWAAAVWSAIAASHLAADPARRRMMLAILIAGAGPLAIRGLLQVWVEHNATVEMFQQTKTAFLADKGWAPDSAAAKIYERRLYQPEALGWFGLGNVYASVMGAMAVMCVGLVIGSIWSRMTSGWTGMAAMLSVAIFAAIFSQVFAGGTVSKGAIVVLALGLAMVVAIAAPIMMHQRIMRQARWLVPALICLCISAIGVRGLLPIDFAHEKSLLFRWFYVEGASGIFASHPWRGVGAAGFQDAFLKFRPPMCPEEPAIAHNVFIDWLCACGVWGYAWIALVSILIRRMSNVDPSKTDDLSKKSAGPPWWPVVLVVFGASAAGAAFEWRVIDGPGLVFRSLGVVMGLALSAISLNVFASVSEKVERWTLVCAALVLLCHGQIEMTFWQPGSVVWAMVLVGLAAYRTDEHEVTRRTQGRSLLAVIPAGLSVGMASCFGVFGAVPAVALDRALMSAAEPLMAFSRFRRACLQAALHDSGTWPTVQVLADQLKAAAAAHSIQLDYVLLNRHSRPIEDRGDLVGDLAKLELQVREGVSNELRPRIWEETEESGMHAMHRHLWLTAVNMKLRSVQLYKEVDSGELRNLEILNWRPSDESISLREALLRAEVFEVRATLENIWGPQVESWKGVSRLDPGNWQWKRRAADAAWKARDLSEASELYRDALRLNENFRLDPLKQMPESLQRQAESRIDNAVNRPDLHPPQPREGSP